MDTVTSKLAPRYLLLCPGKVVVFRNYFSTHPVGIRARGLRPSGSEKEGPTPHACPLWETEICTFPGLLTFMVLFEHFESAFTALYVKSRCQAKYANYKEQTSACPAPRYREAGPLVCTGLRAELSPARKHQPRGFLPVFVGFFHLVKSVMPWPFGMQSSSLKTPEHFIPCKKRGGSRM